MGLSIVAAKGVGKDKLGIYIKAVVEGGAAFHDGRLQAGDQVKAVYLYMLVFTFRFNCLLLPAAARGRQEPGGHHAGEGRRHHDAHRPGRRARGGHAGQALSQ